MKKDYKTIAYRNIFILTVTISIFLFFTILININYLLPDQANTIQTYPDEKLSYDESTSPRNRSIYHPYSIFDKDGYRHKLYPEEAEKYLNSEGFQKIKTAMTEYSIYHVDSTLGEILPNLKYNAYINHTSFGESIYINLSKENLFIYFTPDGKNVSYYYLNDLSTEKTEEVKLDYEARQSYIQECKKFLSIFSTELADSFYPDKIQLDSYGIVYTMKDTKHNISIEYWIVKNRPLGFQFGYSEN